MLCDVKNPGQTVRHSRGVYGHAGFNFELVFREQRIYELDYPRFDAFHCYGVCDSPEQLMAALPNEVVQGPNKYVIALTLVSADDQPEMGGWRWHKWGPYIGEGIITCEHIYDEPVLREALVFHIYRLRDEDCADTTPVSISTD